MPRWASRITLEIVSVRVERLTEISEEEAKAEGLDPVAWGSLPFIPEEFTAKGVIPKLEQLSYKAAFIKTWIDLYGDDSYDKNPWVWVIEFKRLPQ